MPLGTEVDLGPDHIVLDEDPPSPLFGPSCVLHKRWCIVAKRLDGSS